MDVTKFDKLDEDGPVSIDAILHKEKHPKCTTKWVDETLKNDCLSIHRINRIER